MHPLPTFPVPERRPRLGEAMAGYMMSSMELRGGLDVSAVAVSALPPEILREFQRLRACWAPRLALELAAKV
jgi:hypothetical protein